MARCKKCKYFGLDGYINKPSIPYCFKKEEQVLDTNTKRECIYYENKYFKTNFGKRKRRHGRKASGGF